MPAADPSRCPIEPVFVRDRIRLDCLRQLDSDSNRSPVVGILGGSFSPPHIGHVEAARAALDLAPLDGVLVIPAFAHAFGKGLVAFGHRLAMARVAFAPLGPRVAVTDLERLLPRPSYTMNTVEALDRAYAGRVRWRLIVGSDVAGELPLWHRAAELTELAPPLIFNRAGAVHQLPAADPRVLAQGRILIPQVSSTSIRAALGHPASEQDDLLRDLIPNAVLDFIRVHRLERSLAATP
jgi:nicotinate-nucleotide adenylyltransferase